MFFSLFVSCATSFNTRGQFHQVRRAETLISIARYYNIDPQVLAEYNNLEDPHEMQVGAKLYIPPRVKKPGNKRLPLEEQIAAARDSESPRKHRGYKELPGGAEEGGITVDHSRFIWPVDGVIVSGFGFRNGRRHDGVDLKAKEGTPIHAARNGTVVFAGKMRGYGNLVLVRHDDDFFTAYAHNSRNKVKKGQTVKRGETIGLAGHTGRATGPHLHFEVRRGQTARNPLFFLPKRKGDEKV